MRDEDTQTDRENERWPCRWAHSHYSPTRPARYMCYAWGEGGSAARALFLKKKLFLHFEHFPPKKSIKNTRTSTVAAVTSLPRVRFFIFHYESGFVLKIVFEKYLFVAHFSPFFSFFIFEHFSPKKWKKNTRTSMVAAVTSLPGVCFFYFPLREWPRFENCF